MQLVNRRSGLRLLRRDKDDSGQVWWAMMKGSRERTRHQLLTFLVWLSGVQDADLLRVSLTHREWSNTQYYQRPLLVSRNPIIGYSSAGGHGGNKFGRQDNYVSGGPPPGCIRVHKL